MTKKDKGLELLAKLIEEDMEKEIAEIEAKAVEVPEALHNRMLAFVRELDRKDAQRRKNEFRIRTARFAAVFCVCLVTIGTITLDTSEALRERVFALFHNEEDGSVTLRNESEYDIIGNWDDYWYPMWIPEGYYLLGADKEAGVMLYVSDTEDAEIRIIESSLKHTQSHDEDTSDFKEIEVKGYKGYLFTDNENCSIDLVWFTDSRIMEIKVKNLKNEDIVMKIAQNMKYMTKR